MMIDNGSMSSRLHPTNETEQHGNACKPVRGAEAKKEASHGEVDTVKDDAAADVGEAKKRGITGARWASAYTSLLSTVLLFALDGTIVADLQTAIVQTFQTQQSLAWIGVSFILGQMTVLPLGQALGVFDMKAVFIVSLILFEVGSAVCGAASNMAALIVGRVIAGVGGCGIYVGSLTYVAVLTTNHERPIYLAGIYAIWSVGTVLGPIIGGSFAQSSATWRWGFYINLPIAALFAPAYILCLPSINPQPGIPFGKKLLSLDWAAAVIFLAGSACFSIAINFGGTLYSWSSSSEIALLVVTGVLFIAFVLVTIYHPGVQADKKLLPIAFMRTKRDLLILPIEGSLVAGSMFMAIYYTPLLFQFTKGDGPLDGGVRILPLICMLVFFALLNAFLMPKSGYYMPWYVVGNGLLVVGAALMLTINEDTSVASIYGYLALIGSGVGCFQSAGVAVVSAIAPPSDVARAVNVMTIAQISGILAALSISGAIFQNMVVAKVGSVLPLLAREQIVQFTTGTSSPSFQDLNPEAKREVIKQVTETIRSVFGFLVAAAASGFILSLFLGRKRLYLVDGKIAN